MKAVLFSQYGGPEVLSFEDAKKPVISKNQILVHAHAASVNPIDWKIRLGNLKMITGSKFPKMLGTDFAGEVAKVGESVSAYRPGDKVYGAVDPVHGRTYAEYIAVSPDHVAHMPVNMSFEEAATMPTVALTALQSLVHMANVNSNDKLLINGCSGGVGIMAIQFAKAFGATVTGVCSQSGFAISKKMGVDYLIDYHEKCFKDINEKFDIIFDIVANQKFSIAKKILTPKGIYITTSPGTKFFLQSFITIIFGEKRLIVTTVKRNTADLNIIREWIERGRLFTEVDRVYPLSEIQAAHAYSETRRVKGKIAIKID